MANIYTAVESSQAKLHGVLPEAKKSGSSRAHQVIVQEQGGGSEQGYFKTQE